MEIKVMTDILAANEAVAAVLRQRWQEAGVFVCNLMGSPGSGKTSLLERTIAALSPAVRLAVVEGDLFTRKDADRIASLRVPVVQINTRGGCHLDAPMVEAVLPQLDLSGLDLLVIENVGNLVCPAEFNLGEDARVVVLSITEGSDKPLKYPLMFKQAQAVLLNKVDLLAYTDFDLAAVREDIASLNHQAAVFPVSCRTGEGLAAWQDWLCARIREKKSRP